MKAAIFAMESCPKSSRLKALLKIGGITILERQVRVMRHTGVKEIFVLSNSATDQLRAHCAALSTEKLKVHLLERETADSVPLPNQTSDDETWFVCDGASVLDDRLPAFLSQSRHEKIAAYARGTVSEDLFDQAAQFKQHEVDYAFAGCAKIAPDTLRALWPTLARENLEAVLECILKRQPNAVVDLADIAFYDYDLRRDDTFVWMSVKNKDDNKRAKKMLLRRAQKSVLDWPAWFIHQPVEKWAVYHLCETRITPNMITVINMIFAFPAIWLFAQGHIFAGLFMALAAGIIDGMDGKLARTTVSMSKVGKLEEVSDRLYEYGWYWGIAYWLAHSGYGAIAYSLFGALLVLQFTEIMVGWLFKTKRGVQLDDYGTTERNFRWIGSRRNTNMWSLVPFVLTGTLYAGYWFLVVYYFLTMAFRVWRTAYHLLHQQSRRSI